MRRREKRREAYQRENLHNFYIHTLPAVPPCCKWMGIKDFESRIGKRYDCSEGFASPPLLPLAPASWTCKNLFPIFFLPLISSSIRATQTQATKPISEMMHSIECIRFNHPATSPFPVSFPCCCTFCPRNRLQQSEICRAINMPSLPPPRPLCVNLTDSPPLPVLIFHRNTYMEVEDENSDAEDQALNWVETQFQASHNMHSLVIKQRFTTVSHPHPLLTSHLIHRAF